MVASSAKDTPAKGAWGERGNDTTATWGYLHFLSSLVIPMIDDDVMTSYDHKRKL